MGNTPTKHPATDTEILTYRLFNDAAYGYTTCVNLVEEGVLNESKLSIPLFLAGLLDGHNAHCNDNLDTASIIRKYFADRKTDVRRKFYIDAWNTDIYDIVVAIGKYGRNRHAKQIEQFVNLHRDQLTPNYQVSSGMTGLMYAIVSNQTKVIEILETLEGRDDTLNLKRDTKINGYKLRKGMVLKDIIRHVEEKNKKENFKPNNDPNYRIDFE